MCLVVVLQAASVAGAFRRTVHKKLIAMEERQIAAECRTKAAKESMQLISSDVEAARAHVVHLIAINQRLKGTAKAEEEWSKKGKRTALKGIVLGPITLEVGCKHSPGELWCCALKNCRLKSQRFLYLAEHAAQNSCVICSEVLPLDPQLVVWMSDHYKLVGRKYGFYAAVRLCLLGVVKLIKDKTNQILIK
jgi:hypothetical protein